MNSDGDYCSFSKAVEHLGDCWSFVILRELYMHGTRGFNALAEGLPGVSRSVLAARLRKLEDLDLIQRDPEARRGVAGYCLTSAGRDLGPVMRRLWSWSQRWLPEAPEMAERDPDIIIAWLSQRLDSEGVPERRVVLQLDVDGTRMKRFWFVLERGQNASPCLEDPCLAADRYVFVEATAGALLPIARGHRGWSEAIADGSVRLYGEPELVAGLPAWFQRATSAGHTERGAAVA